MSVTIQLMLAGLIALVPSQPQNTRMITAHLVKDDPGEFHEPALIVFGKAKLNSGGKICKEEGSGMITCDLKGTTIMLGGVDPARLELPPIQRPPGRIRPKPDVFNDFRSLDWLVRMSDVERGTGAPDQNKIKNKTWARMSFSSNTVLTGELDGSEAGQDKEEVIGFRKGGSSSLLTQVVGESLAFALSVNPDTFAIVLKRGNVQEKITAAEDCRSNGCMNMELKNEYTGPHEPGDGDHFKHYYKLVKDSKSELLPFSVNPNRPSIEDTEKHVSVELLKDILRIVRPAAPDKIDAAIQELELNNDDKRKELQSKKHDYLGQILRKNGVKDEIIKAVILDMRRIQDRVICPPVLLDAP